MSDSQQMLQVVSFAVRTRDTASLADFAKRVGAALRVTFEPSTSSRYRDAMSAEVLGLEVSITYWPPKSEGELRTYQLTGYPADDVNEPSDRVVDIGQFVLAALAARDKSAWYIPDRAELRRELDSDGS
jgi:hypothetical protein